MPNQLDVYEEGSHTSDANSSLVPSGGDGRAGLTTRIRRRREPSQIEQTRREEWGRKWGKVNSEHAKRIRERDG